MARYRVVVWRTIEVTEETAIYVTADTPEEAEDLAVKDPSCRADTRGWKETQWTVNSVGADEDQTIETQP